MYCLEVGCGTQVCVSGERGGGWALGLAGVSWGEDGGLKEFNGCNIAELQLSFTHIYACLTTFYRLPVLRRYVLACIIGGISLGADPASKELLSDGNERRPIAAFHLSTQGRVNAFIFYKLIKINI